MPSHFAELRPSLATMLCLSLHLIGGLFACQTDLYAQTLPVVGHVLWKIDYQDANPTGAIDYAPETDLVFGGCSGRKIFVVKGSTGEILDTIWTTDWALLPGVRPLNIVSDLSCSHDGSLIAITVRNDDNCKVVLLEYPSKRILMDSLYVGMSQEWRIFRIKVSPSGRYVVVPNPGNLYSSGIRLYDRDNDTMYVLANGSTGGTDFDDAEQMMVFTTHGYIDGETNEFANCVSLLNISEQPYKPRQLQEYGRGTLSSDGAYVMISGYGGKKTLTNHIILGGPRASVYSLANDSLLWRTYGDLSGLNDWDFTMHQWSKDATKLFAFRDSKYVPADWRSNGVLYNVGDSLPYARPCNDCITFGEWWTDANGSVFTPDLQIAFFNGLTGLRASSMVSPTSAPEVVTEGADIIYPNPTTGEVRVRCSTAGIATSWALASIGGEQVTRGTIEISKQNSKSECSITLSKELMRGTYFLSLMSERGAVLCTQKVVLQ